MLNVKCRSDYSVISVQNDESLRGHCRLQMRKRDKKVRRDLRREQMRREGAAVTCDGIYCSTDVLLRQETLCRRQCMDRRVRRTSRVVDEAERNRRLDSVSAGRRTVVRHAGRPTLAPDHVRICTPKLRLYK